MSALLETISNNQLISGLVVVAVAAVVGAVWKWVHDRRDSNKIYDFLLKSKSGTDFTFRSTEAISSSTKIPEKRVSLLCSKHPKIRRNEKEKQSWKLV